MIRYDRRVTWTQKLNIQLYLAHVARKNIKKQETKTDKTPVPLYCIYNTSVTHSDQLQCLFWSWVNVRLWSSTALFACTLSRPHCLCSFPQSPEDPPFRVFILL